MANGVELATAWLRIVPSFSGVTETVQKELNPLDDAAEKAGQSSGKKFSAGMGMVMAAAGAAIIGGLIATFKTGIEELKFGEEISAQTDILIKNTGFAMKTEEIENFTLALSRVSGISEEDLQLAGNNILKFGDISEENFQKAVDSVNNLGAAGKDVTGVSEALGKALADPANAAGLLKRQGVILTDQQKEMIDTFTAAGDKAGAQGVILDALEDTYGGMAEAAGGTLTGGINKLNNAWENTAGNLVQSVMPAILALVDVLQVLLKWAEANPVAVQAIALALGVLAIAFIGVTVATWAMNTALLANPITWIILAIVALIAIILLLILNWDAVVAFVTDVWEGFVGWFTGVMDGFLGWWGGIWDAIVGWVTDVINNIIAWVSENWGLLLSLLIGPLGLVIQWVVEHWGEILDFFQQVWTNIVNFFTTALNAFVAFWVGVWTGISTFFTDLWNGIVAVVTGIFMAYISWIMGAINGFIGFWTGAWNTVSGVISSVFTGISTFISGIWTGIVNGIKNSVNSIISIINGMIDGVNDIVSTAGEALGIDFTIPHIPMLAKGGTLTSSGSVIVGEKGPELLTLPRGAQVNPDFDELGDGKKIIFENHAPLGQSPAQALDEFANRAEDIL